MPLPKELSEEAVETLWLLWNDRSGKRFSEEGLTVDEIAKATEIPLQRIYNAIEQLSTRDEKWNTIMEVRNKRPGGKAKCYKLYTDNVPDWPRASFLLLELDSFDKRHSRQIDAVEFCEHLVKDCVFRNQDDVDEIVRGLCGMDYLYRSPSLPTLATDEKPGYLILSLNERFRSELDFLTKIALLHSVSEYVLKQKREIKTSYFLQSRP
jgi:hypothetical protein